MWYVKKANAASRLYLQSIRSLICQVVPSKIRIQKFIAFVSISSSTQVNPTPHPPFSEREREKQKISS